MIKNNILKLKDGMVLRLLPFSKNYYFDTQNLYYFYNKKKPIIISNEIKNYINEKILFSYRSEINRVTRNFSFVEYNNEIKIIYFGRKIKTIIEDSLLYLNEYKDCLFLHVDIRNNMGFPDYDSSFIKININKKFKYTTDEYFKSKEYEKILNNYYEYLKNLKPNNEIIDYLINKDILDENYMNKLRLNKINKLSELCVK